LFLFTEVFAIINAIEEAMPSLVFTLFFTGIAGISQLPGLLIARWRWKTRSPVAIPMELEAYVIAMTGCGAYAVYAFDGRADSLNSSAHLHAIAFPLAHAVLAVVVYIACAIVSGTISAFTNPPTWHWPNPAFHLTAAASGKIKVHSLTSRRSR
jgi:hypothetical protein